MHEFMGYLTVTMYINDTLKISQYITPEQVNIFLFDSDLSILFIFFHNTDSKCTHFCVIKYIHSSQY